MLSGEGNDGERGLISKKKKNFARAAHFFCHFFAVVLHDYNAKLREFFFFLWRKRLTRSRSLFVTAAHFLLALVAASISHFVAAVTK